MRILAANLNRSFTEDDIRALFADYGPITSVERKMSKTNIFMGNAFIELELGNEAVDALGGTTPENNDGRKLFVGLAPVI